MPFKLSGASGTAVEVGAAAAAAMHFTQKPVPHGTGGHYRTNHRCALVATQAANSRLFEVRNSSASLLLIPTRLVVRWLQTSTHTAAIEDSLDVFKVTGFSVVDTVNTVTPAASQKRVTMAATAAAAIRGVTIAGAAAGMTGGTLTKDSTTIGELPKWLLAAVPTAGEVKPDQLDVFDDVNGTHPFVLAQNEGIIIENRVLLGAAAGSSVYVDFSWVEVAAF
ncbi:MAG: hypothetical protein ACJ8AD_14855 [Gemmatimonadaceae bacterium]